MPIIAYFMMDWVFVWSSLLTFLASAWKQKWIFCRSKFRKYTNIMTFCCCYCFLLLSLYDFVSVAFNDENLGKANSHFL